MTWLRDNNTHCGGIDMSDKLTNRLRGQYKVGPDNVYGTRSFADFIPPISLEAADRIELLERYICKVVEMDMDEFSILEPEDVYSELGITS